MDGKQIILIVGAGGREHALAWKLSQSPLVEHIFVAPGNGGTSQVERTTNVDLPVESDFKSLVKFATEKLVTLVVPGPEQPLVDGIESAFRKVGIPVFGPSARAARMEGSKAFSKAFMTRHGIPTAAYKVFNDTQYEQAVSYVMTCGFNVVLKADGLAAGKGVLIPQNEDEAIEGLRDILVAKKFGGAGNEVVVEEYLSGPELSVLAFSDGYTIVPLPAAQDHKRVGEGDTGPNTGGMGAYAPAPIATLPVMQKIINESLQPTIDGMRHEGFPFVGLLFTGFILTEAGPKVLEYNVRFGDPETEAIMLLLDDCDLGEIILACVERRLDSVKIKVSDGFAVSVVLASEGYPGSYAKGKYISFGDVPSDVQVFHAGTTVKGEGVVTSGGRVLVVSASGPSVREAVDKVYAAVNKINFEGVIYRKDIAHRALRTDAATNKASLTYAQAGVSVDAGNEFVNQIKSIVKSTRRPGSDGVIGGFGAVFDLKSTGYNDPLLVSGTDGVGTKLHVAMAAGVHDTVGIDLVAMSVNDLLVQGAEPLFFLDYYACSRLQVDVAVKVVKGIADGCIDAGCALVGGETAEMPGMYNGDDYDLAGFAVGIVERNALLPHPDITEGDVLLGLPSSGLHSNGFSLVRKIISLTGLEYSSPCPWSLNITLGAALLVPTRIYVKSLLPTIRTGYVKGLSHITGGGFLENIPRVFPPGLGCYIDVSAWPLPPVFQFLMKYGNVEPQEMCRTFNNGVAMVLIVAQAHVEEVKQSLLANGEHAIYEIGKVVTKQGVELRGIDSWLTN